jgi:hypothetical protein
VTIPIFAPLPLPIFAPLPLPIFDRPAPPVFVAGEEMIPDLFEFPFPHGDPQVVEEDCFLYASMLFGMADQATGPVFPCSP